MGVKIDTITVFTGRDGTTASLLQPGKLIFYCWEKDSWNSIRERDFYLNNDDGIPQLRRKMEEVLEFMGDCKTFVGSAVIGLPYFILEKAGCSIWEFPGKPAAFLDQILAEENHASCEQTGRGKENTPPAPEEIAPGCYRISLLDIQTKNPGITSKQVLIPFLAQTRFYSLEIHCRHIPPWLENKPYTDKFLFFVDLPALNRIILTLKPKTCLD